MINGVNQATFWFAPMLAERHPETYPRFRDCFIGIVTTDWSNTNMGIPTKKIDISPERYINILTRTGGGNREDYAAEIEELRAFPTYVKDEDDSFDSTFALFTFTCPPEFEKDYDLILEGKITETSKAYQQRVITVFPKLKDKLEVIFSGSSL